MLSIIDNILKLARIENNKVILEESIVRLEENFDSCLVMFHSALEDKKQELTVTKDIHYPYVYMDSAHFTEIILNIVSNAIKYTGECGKISCNLRQESYIIEGWCVTELAVTDTGIGMSEEFLAGLQNKKKQCRNAQMRRSIRRVSMENESCWQKTTN